MVELKLVLKNNKYNDYELRDTITINEVKIEGFDPIKHKLLSFDVFQYDPITKNVELVHSIVRHMPLIAGILKLSDNKTYGNNKDKLLYKCIPDDKRIAEFLIPYKIKKIGFSKHQKNKYVTFRFKNWNNKHPVGELCCVLGNTDVLEFFYEYQLYCKSLYASIQDFTKAAKAKLKEKSEDELIKKIDSSYVFEDRTDQSIWQIYTIDPLNSKDFDDAFSFKQHEDYNILSIYITNVAIWMNVMELWNSFSQRISTIYLPDRKRPMLPTIMSEFLCSLLEKQTRYTFTIDFVINKEGTVISHSFCNTKIRVTKNFTYNNPNVPYLNDLLKFLNIMNKKHYYMDFIKDSHDAIAYMMILMNYFTAKEFLKYKTGIFRSMKLKNVCEIPEYLPVDIQMFLKTWNSNGSKYISFEEEKIHEMMKINEYVHVTSPIRRLVDLINLVEIQHHLGLMEFNNHSNTFYTHWTQRTQLDYINQTMRSIRKVQNECNLLTKCIKEPLIMAKKYDGYIFDIMQRNDGLYQYVVLLQELKMINKFISYQKLEKYKKYKFRIYLFEDEDCLKQKVRYELETPSK
jgi:exoribonuclease R